MKYLIIIPGFGEYGKEKEYKTVSKNAKINGFSVFIMVPEWGKTTMSDCVLNIENKIQKLKRLDYFLVKMTGILGLRLPKK